MSNEEMSEAEKVRRRRIERKKRESAEGSLAAVPSHLKIYPDPTPIELVVDRLKENLELDVSERIYIWIDGLGCVFIDEEGVVFRCSFDLEDSAEMRVDMEGHEIKALVFDAIIPGSVCYAAVETKAMAGLDGEALAAERGG